MRSLKWLLGLLMLYAAFFVSATWHGGLLGTALIKAQEPAPVMGPHYMLKPGQKFKADDGTQFTIEQGEVFEAPAGLTIDMTRNGPWWECSTPYKDTRGNCADDTIIHYINQKTGTKYDIHVAPGPKMHFTVVGPMSRLYLGFATEAFAAAGDDLTIGGTTFVAVKVTPDKNKSGFVDVTAVNTQTNAIVHFTLEIG